MLAGVVVACFVDSLRSTVIVRHDGLYLLYFGHTYDGCTYYGRSWLGAWGYTYYGQAWSKGPTLLPSYHPSRHDGVRREGRTLHTVYGHLAPCVRVGAALAAATVVGTLGAHRSPGAPTATYAHASHQGAPHHLRFSRACLPYTVT